MAIFRVFFAVALLFNVAGAAEIQSLSGNLTTPLTPPGQFRFFGSPFSITITLTAPMPAGTTPDPAGISVTGAMASGGPTNLTVIQTGAALTEIQGSSRLQWRYTAVPLRDGPATLTILPAAFNSAPAPTPTLTQPIILDTLPVVVFTTSVTPPLAVTFNGSLVSGIDLITPEPTPGLNSSNISIINGELTTPPPTLVGTNITINVTAFGFGDVTCTAAPGTVADQWGNTNGSVSKIATVSSAGLGSAPTITQVIGLSPDNRVYHTGETINLAVIFSRAVTFAPPTATNRPFLRLNSTGSALAQAVAIYTGSNSPTQLNFSYTVESGNSKPFLDVSGTDAFVIPSQTGVIGTATTPDFIANTTLASPGSSGSLSTSFLYSINVEAAKPDPDDINGTSNADKCAVGSGIGLLLSLGALSLFSLRQRR